MTGADPGTGYAADGTDLHEALIARLTTDLRPVRRLATPARRAALWLGVLAVLAVALAVGVPLAPIARRLLGADDMWLSVVGSVATAVLAAIAAFQLSLPDRSRAWLLLPLPAAALWLGASGMGCLRAAPVPDATMPRMMETMHCLCWIIGFSVPLSALLLLMLRRAHPLRPGPVAAMAGLAAAAGAASLLWFEHPFDASALDLAVHAGAVLLVIGANRAAGGRVLAAA